MTLENLIKEITSIGRMNSKTVSNYKSDVLEVYGYVTDNTRAPSLLSRLTALSAEDAEKLYMSLWNVIKNDSAMSTSLPVVYKTKYAVAIVYPEKSTEYRTILTKNGKYVISKRILDPVNLAVKLKLIN